MFHGSGSESPRPRVLRFEAMSAAMPFVQEPEESERRDDDQYVHLHGVTWADYQRLLEIRGESAVPRITYVEGLIEIMSPSRSHDSIKSIIGRLVETFCLAQGIEFSTYGSWTLESKESERGAEADECWVIGEELEPERPDIAVEVVWTSGGINKLQVYRKLGVREVWYWKKETITVYALRGDEYEPLARSELLPTLDLDHLATFINRGKTTSQIIRDYRASLEAPRG